MMGVMFAIGTLKHIHSLSTSQWLQNKPVNLYKTYSCWYQCLRSLWSLCGRKPGYLSHTAYL